MSNLLLSKKIRQRLNSANQEFSKQIKKNKNISDNFKIIDELYQAIIKDLESISSLASELQFYKLAAELGSLQCKVNSFELSPLNDSTLQENEDRLKNFAIRIHYFLNLSFQLEAKLNFHGDLKLYKQFYVFKRQLNHYAKNWEKYENNIIAAYSYNYADLLLKTKPVSIEKIEKSILYFQQSSVSYANNMRHKENEKVHHKINEAKALLDQLQLEQTTQLKVTIPIFLISRIKNEIIQSVSIHDSSPRLTHSKIKPAPPKSPSSSTQIKLTLRGHARQRQKLKNGFFQPKETRQVVEQNYRFSNKNL